MTRPAKNSEIERLIEILNILAPHGHEIVCGILQYLSAARLYRSTKRRGGPKEFTEHDFEIHDLLRSGKAKNISEAVKLLSLPKCPSSEYLGQKGC